MPSPLDNHPAVAFRNLERCLGYIQNGSQQPVSIWQDDATGWWSVTCGHINSSRAHREYSAASLTEAIALAKESESEG